MIDYFRRLHNEAPYALGPDSPVPAILAKGYELSMHFRTPFFFGICYLLIVGYYNRRRPIKENYLEGFWGRTFMAVHNAALCIYSVWTFLVVAPAVYKSFRDGFQAAGMKGLRHAYCDSDDRLFSDYILHYGYLFYLSKYWEVIDTAILFMKGKKVALLQSYHHFGAMLAMWSGIRYNSTPILFFCVFNSFIHSIMYFYFFLSVYKIRVPGFFRQTLTSLQLLQFVLGGSLALSYLFLSVPEISLDSMKREAGRCMDGEGASFAVLLNVFYLMPLTGLFLKFYAQSYLKRYNKSKTA